VHVNLECEKSMSEPKLIQPAYLYLFAYSARRMERRPRPSRSNHDHHNANRAHYDDIYNRSQCASSNPTCSPNRGKSPQQHSVCVMNPLDHVRQITEHWQHERPRFGENATGSQEAQRGHDTAGMYTAIAIAIPNCLARSFVIGLDHRVPSTKLTASTTR
jgi:hypothetical protein